MEKHGNRGGTFCKVTPQNLDTTVFDTDDLSTIRGASLTLLNMPRLLKDHLEREFPSVIFEWLQLSASELVFCCVREMDAPDITITPIKSKPSSGNKQRWNKILQTAADKIKPVLDEQALLSEADDILRTCDTDLSKEVIAGQILSRCGTVGPTRQQVDDLTRGDMQGSIEEFLSGEREGYPFDLMTFNVGWSPPEKQHRPPRDIFDALNTGLALCQLKSLCFHAPAPVPLNLDTRQEVPRICPVSRVLLSEETGKRGGLVSDSVRRRRDVGREGKAGFYEAVLEDGFKLAVDEEWASNSAVSGARDKIEHARNLVHEFANDFGEIARDPPEYLAESPKTKLCLLKMDGNSFGALRAGQTDINSYSRLSRHLDILKVSMLADILIWIDETPGMKNGDRARFETLLWGGDEFTFVLPAWFGWEFFIRVHNSVKDWKDLDGGKLSFATGLVFAPHKAPIRDLRNVSEKLVEFAKGDRKVAAVQALAFEGVDRVHMDPATFRQTAPGADLEQGLFSIQADCAAGLPASVKRTMSVVSRSALHGIWHEYRDSLARKEFDHTPVIRDLRRITPAVSEDDFEDAVKTLFPGGDYPLLFFSQICQLVDYILPGEGRVP